MIDTKAAKQMAETAWQLGCAPDQLERFLAAGYVPQPKQMAFHGGAREADHSGGPTQLAQGGARGGAKSHAALCQMALDDCARVPNLKWLYLRSVGKSARESFEDFLKKAVPNLLQYYVPSRMKLAFSNGSEILLGGFRTAGDIDQYIGIEYDGIMLDDTQLIPPERRKALFASMRTSKANWRPRGYLTFNPGGVGHAALKREFVEPWRAKREVGTRFYFSLPEDNKFLNPEYIAYLDSLTGWYHRAWRRGDFDIASGQFFSTWRSSVHVIEPFDLGAVHGRSWWLSFDYGFVHPTCAHLHTSDDDGNVYTIDEYWAMRKSVAENAAGILGMLKRHKLEPEHLRVIRAGTDVFSKRDDGPTVAARYKEHGLRMKPANTDRINGAANMLALLGDVENGIHPRWFVWENCTKLIEQMPTMQHDPHRPEDVLKVNVDDTGMGGDDSYDSARYGLMEVDKPKFATAFVDWYASPQAPAPELPQRSEREVREMLSQYE